MTQSSEPVLGLRAQNKADVERRIREAAQRLLSRHDFDEITTREVAQEADIGEATLFRYVSSKEGLLSVAYGDQMDALIERLLREDEEKASGTAENGHCYFDRVKAFYRGRAEFYLRNPGNASRYLRQAFDPANPNRERTIAQGDRLIARAASILAEGQRRGLLNDSVDPLLVAQNCHGIFIHEVDRTPTRGFSPESIWTRVLARLDAQLLPLLRESTSAARVDEPSEEP